MTEGRVALNGSGNQTIYINTYRTGQNQGGNYSSYRSYGIYEGNGWGSWTGATQYWSANLGGVGLSGTFTIPYENRNGNITMFDHYWDRGHNSDGYGYGFTSSFSIDTNHTSIGDGTVSVWEGDPPRIPKLPAAPTPIGIDEVTSSGFRYRFSGNDDGGSGILEWQAQTATNTGYSANVVTVSSSGTTTFTGLLPGNTYYARSRGRNAVGWGGWSSNLSVYVGLPAPTFNSLTQNSSGALVAAWSAPSTTTGLTGYRVQVATNSSFTENVVNTDFGNVLTGNIPGLAGGRQYYARVAARTAGGINAYSGTLSHVLVLDAGDLDGWTRFGTKPANISYYTTEGIRRGVVGTKQALYLESLATGSATLTANAFGMQKTITGLTVGKAYRFEASGTLTNGSAPGNHYSLNVVSESASAGTDITTGGTDFPAIEFVADATSVTLQIRLAETLTISGAQNVVENIAFHTIKLLELDTDFPQRLRGTVYESNLANHFDLACNSVGATWYVAKDGVTRFNLPGAALPVSARFSDESDPAAVSYIDITTGRDTRTTVNRIEATNYGVDATGDLEENDELIVEDTASQIAYGVYRSTLALNLFDEAPYDDSFSDRLADLLNTYKTPVKRVSALRWNAQEDLALATALEVGQRINVRYAGADYDSQIASIQHDFTPTRWIITLTLQPL